MNLSGALIWHLFGSTGNGLKANHCNAVEESEEEVEHRTVREFISAVSRRTTENKISDL